MFQGAQFVNASRGNFTYVRGDQLNWSNINYLVEPDHGIAGKHCPLAVISDLNKLQPLSLCKDWLLLLWMPVIVPNVSQELVQTCCRLWKIGSKVHQGSIMFSGYTGLRALERVRYRQLSQTAFANWDG